MYRITDSRTATIHSRKKPNNYSQVLMTANNNGRLYQQSKQQQPQSEQQSELSNQLSFGTNFNTNFNTEYNNTINNDNDLKDNNDIINEQPQQQQQQQQVSSKVLIPRISRNLSYRVLYRLRSPTLNNDIKNNKNNRRKFYNGINGFDFIPPSNLIRLFGESSVPGVRDIALSQSFVRRMFWICSFFFFGFLALRDISQLVSEYYTYPIVVDVRLRDSRRLQFPAVTVCNLNIVRYSSLCNNNVSVIKDSMIPRDLREKLCGQPSSGSMTDSVISTTTTSPLTISTRKQEATSLSPTTIKSRRSSTKIPKISTKLHKTSTKSPKTLTKLPKTSTKLPSKISTRTTTMTTTQSSTNSDHDGMDDINTYGVASNFSDNGNNDTMSLNETDIDPEWNLTTISTAIVSLSSSPLSSTTSASTTATITTTTTEATTKKSLADDIPNDIAGPIDIQLDRPKRQIKINKNIENTKNSANNTATNNAQDNQKQHQQQSSDTKESTPANFDNIESTEREEKELQENLTNWLAVIYNSNEKIAKQIGHQFEDLVLRCTIRSTNCAFANSFEHFFTPTEGNCFTFKSQNLRKTNLERIKDETSIAGVNYGLELVLNLEISEYLIGTAQIGAIVMIQHPDEIGNSASEAIFVAPKQSTYIGMKMVNISRLPKPFPEECIDHWPAGLVGRLTQNASYSQQACLKICLQRTIHTRCQCQSAQLPQLELNSTLKICDTRRKTTRNCVEEVMFQAEEKVSTCKCPPRCQVINYDKTVSMTKWPTREDRVTFDRDKDDMNFQNLAKVTVYFQTMTCQEVRQEKAYTTAKLFSSLGGILGMYVGFSFLSLFEIIEIFGRRFWYIVTKKKLHFRGAAHAIRATIALNRKKPIKVNDNNNNNNKQYSKSKK